MLEVPPVPAQRVPAHGSDMVMNAKLRPGQSLQEDAEASRRDVEAAGLDPNTVRIGYPSAIVIDVRVDDEVIAVTATWVETVGYTAESGDRHFYPPRKNRGAPKSIVRRATLAVMELFLRRRGACRRVGPAGDLPVLPDPFHDEGHAARLGHLRA